VLTAHSGELAILSEMIYIINGMKRQLPYKIYSDSSSRKNPFGWQCGACGRKFTRKASLQYHFESYHAEIHPWVFIKFVGPAELGDRRKKRRRQRK
jgi:hypothetical protein